MKLPYISSLADSIAAPGLHTLSIAVLDAFKKELSILSDQTEQASPGPDCRPEIATEQTLHMSLSRPFILRKWQIESFLNRLAQRLRSYKRYTRTPAV